VVHPANQIVVGRQRGLVTLRWIGTATAREVTVTEGSANYHHHHGVDFGDGAGEAGFKDLPLNRSAARNLMFTLNRGAVQNYSALKSGRSGFGGRGLFLWPAGGARQHLPMNGIEYTGSSNIGITPGGGQRKCVLTPVRGIQCDDRMPTRAEYGSGQGRTSQLVSASPAQYSSRFALRSFCAIDVVRPELFRSPECRELGGKSIPPLQAEPIGGRGVRSKKIIKRSGYGSYEGFRQRLADFERGHCSRRQCAGLEPAVSRQGQLRATVVPTQRPPRTVIDRLQAGSPLRAGPNH